MTEKVKNVEKLVGKVSSDLPESNRFGVKRSARARVRDRKVMCEPNTAIVQMGVPQKLQIAQSQSAEVEFSGGTGKNGETEGEVSEEEGKV